MQQYRSRLRIISDILSVVLNSSGEGGASPSVLMRRSNLSYRGMEAFVSQLLAAGLLLESRDPRGVKYQVSAKGAEYLQHYLQFEAFAESYGLLL